MDSSQQDSQSQITQGESFALSADFENCYSGHGSTVPTNSPITDWNETLGAKPPIAPVLAQSQVN